MQSLQAKLDKFISKLPKKMQFPYKLCKNQEELLEHLKEQDENAYIWYHLNYPKECIKEDTDSYFIRRPKAKLPKKQREPLHGLSTKIIGINAESEELNFLIFVYLHEAGHWVGKSTKSKKKLNGGFFNEELADDIAHHYLTKHWKRKRNFTK